LIEKNANNIAHLQEIDSMLLDELKKFESDIIAEIDKVAREFMSHQTQYAKKVIFHLVKLKLREYSRCMRVG